MFGCYAAAMAAEVDVITKYGRRRHTLDIQCDQVFWLKSRPITAKSAQLLQNILAPVYLLNSLILVKGNTLVTLKTTQFCPKVRHQ